MALMDIFKVYKGEDQSGTEPWRNYLPETLVVCTDFSANARESMLNACKLFGNSIKKIVLVNIYSIPNISIGSLVTVRDILFQLSEEGLHEEEVILRKELKNQNIEIEKICEGGKLSKKLAEIAGNYNKPIISLGAIGASEMDNVLFGSVTSDAISTLDNVPMFCMPPQTKFEEVKNILYLSDINEINNINNLDTIIGCGLAFDATIHVAHISERNILLPSNISAADRDLMPVYNDLFPEVKFTYQNLNGVEPIGIQLDNIGKALDVDLLYMVLNEDGFLNDVFNEKMANKQSFYNSLPTICYRIK